MSTIETSTQPPPAPAGPTIGVAVEPPVITPQPPRSLARGLAVRGSQGDWFPQDSYPASARRTGAEGVVSVAVTVGTDGRVDACRVTASSGNGALDAATCRLATRNGRFSPALAADGLPVAAMFALRNVRWTIADQ